MGKLSPDSKLLLLGFLKEGEDLKYVHQAQSPQSVDHPPTIAPLKMKANGESRWNLNSAFESLARHSLLFAQNSTKLGSRSLFVGPKIFDSRVSVQ